MKDNTHTEYTIIYTGSGNFHSIPIPPHKKMNPLTSSSVMAMLRGSTSDHMEETGPEEPEVKCRTSYIGCERKKQLNICHESLGVPLRVLTKDCFCLRR